MKQDLVIGLDASTTATKAIAWDRRGHLVAEGRAAVSLCNPKPGWYEQEVSDWTGAAAKAANWFSSIPEAAAKMSGKPSKIFRPRTKQNKAYSEFLSIYIELWPQVSNWNAKLQDLAGRQNG